jgi:putative oxygen-independent coproporphyrinogen III oxidase
MKKHSSLLTRGSRTTIDMTPASDLAHAEKSTAGASRPGVSPRAAYIHVPFCRHRCGYCNFTLVALRDDLIDAYLEALERELSGLSQPREVDTLFFGGGTPSHLSAEHLERLLEIVRRWLPPSGGAEVSVEVNPIDLGDVKARVFADAGVTRISLGAQSFQAWKLAALERDHDAATIRAAVERARQFAKSISLDLIFGVPGESLMQWRDDLQPALALAPDHVSTYGLTFEKGKSFWSWLNRGELSRLDEELERQMYEAAIDALTAAGFEHYEVSNFARPGHRCRHNENYWLGGQYFAAGPGAARFIAGRRQTNHRSTTTYISRVLAGQSPVAEAEQLAPEDAARERLVFALRRLEGIDTADFAAATGFGIEQLGGEGLCRMIDLGLLELSGNRLHLTRAGLLVSDAIWPEFLRT